MAIERILGTDSGKAAFEKADRNFVAHEGQINDLASPPTCSVYPIGNQSIANATETIISFDAEYFDNKAMHDNSVENSKIICKEAGNYLIVANVSTSGTNSAAVINLAVKINGQVIDYDSKLSYSGGLSGTRLNKSIIKKLSINDFVQISVEQASGSSITIAGSRTSLSIVKVGD